MSGVTAVLFDFDHTLGVDHHLERDVLIEMAVQRGGDPPDESSVQAALRRFRDGSTPLDQAIAEAFAHWGCDACDPPVVALEFRSRCLAEVPQRVEALPGALATVDALRERGKTVAILTNGWTDLQRAKAAAVGFPGPVFVSEQIRAWKPDPAAFHHTCSALGCEPITSLYVGDDARTDVAGAKAAGLLAAWADVDGTPGRYPPNVVEPDLVITELPQLVPVMDETV